MTVLLPCLLACAATGALAAPAAPPSVTLPGGAVLACSDSGPSTASCRGVQYGTAERWKRPAMAKLTGAHDATAFGADCQSSPEACLYLNVYAPKAALGKGPELPVMVWIRAHPRCPLYPPAHPPALPSLGP